MPETNPQTKKGPTYVIYVYIVRVVCWYLIQTYEGYFIIYNPNVFSLLIKETKSEHCYPRVTYSIPGVCYYLLYILKINASYLCLAESWELTRELWALITIQR